MRLNVKVLYLIIALCLFISWLFVYLYLVKPLITKEILQDTMYLGKDLTITISENKIIDAEYLQNILDGKMDNDLQKFNLWDTQELIKLIDYMDKNCFVIDAGKYTFNQSWGFDDGFFILNDNEKREVFKFKRKE